MPSTPFLDRPHNLAINHTLETTLPIISKISKKNVKYILGLVGTFERTPEKFASSQINMVLPKH